jgi:transcriptional regulator with XRE-family HTH domain
MTNRSDHPGTAEGTVEALELVDGLCVFASFADLLSAFRMCDEMSQAEFAEMLGVSGSTISGIENGDQIVSLETAAAWAAAIGYPATVFVERALQDQLDRADLAMKVYVEEAEAEAPGAPTTRLTTRLNRTNCPIRG